MCKQTKFRMYLRRELSQSTRERARSSSDKVASVADKSCGAVAPLADRAG